MTDNIDRRKFIKTAVGTAVGAVVAANLPAQAGEQGSKTAPGTEKIFLGGTIITMDDGRREVEAVAIAGGRILAAGDEAEVMKTGTEATEIVDLGGKTLMPSFIDAHGHFMNAPQIVKWANVSAPRGSHHQDRRLRPGAAGAREEAGNQEGRVDHRLRLRPLEPRRGA